MIRECAENKIWCRDEWRCSSCCCEIFALCRYHLDIDNDSRLVDEPRLGGISSRVYSATLLQLLATQDETVGLNALSEFESGGNFNLSTTSNHKCKSWGIIRRIIEEKKDLKWHNRSESLCNNELFQPLFLCSLHHTLMQAVQIASRTERNKNRCQWNKRKCFAQLFFLKDNITVCYLFFNSILIWYHLSFVPYITQCARGPVALQQNVISFLSRIFIPPIALLLFCVISTFIFDTSLFIYPAWSAMKYSTLQIAFNKQYCTGECSALIQAAFRIVLVTLIVSSLVGFALRFCKGRAA